SVHAKAHDTSLAVWDIPSPLVAGERFAIKVGAKSSAACELAGRGIEICDDAGTVVARTKLNATPLAGTSALYWADVALTAPTAERLHIWSARFDAAELDLPHEGAAASFSFLIGPKREHQLSVKVMERESNTPVVDAEVLIGPYRGRTDA